MREFELDERIRSVVRIWDAPGDRPVGVGFLLDSCHVMTCAHVVTQVFGKEESWKTRLEPPVG